MRRSVPSNASVPVHDSASFGLVRTNCAHFRRESSLLRVRNAKRRTPESPLPMGLTRASADLRGQGFPASTRRRSLVRAQHRPLRPQHSDPAQGRQARRTPCNSSLLMGRLFLLNRRPMRCGVMRPVARGGSEPCGVPINPDRALTYRRATGSPVPADPRRTEEAAGANRPDRNGHPRPGLQHREFLAWRKPRES